jgi:arylsulfatase A-like enzyme
MSEPYAAAARRLDATTGLVRALALDPAPDDTLLLVCADHGGGGATARDHESDHHLDRTIPIILAGGGVAPGAAIGHATILDIPATILGALGVECPDSYAGRILGEALLRLEAAA